jgi:GH15 family glucan-1,4-alpha-glucosidase
VPKPRPRIDEYAPIGSYALLADMNAAALVSTDGAVDWLAAPCADTPPLCAAILDPTAGGRITLRPTVPYEVTRSYDEGTLVLRSTFTTADGSVQVTDSLNRGTIGRLPWTELARRVDGLSGSVPMAWEVAPGHALSVARPFAWCEGDTPRLTVDEIQLAVVANNIGTPQVTAHDVNGEFVVESGAPALLGLVISRGEPLCLPSPASIYGRIERTRDTWRAWSEQLAFDGPGKDIVIRSALTIKALTSESTGGIAAAATTSLPEAIGGSRNYDYRYSWIRDSSFALDAMCRLGLDEEVHGSILWLVRAGSTAPDLRTFYALDGSWVSDAMREVEAPGYRRSRPVLVGNQAASQTQLGCFGDLLDAIYQHIRGGGRLDPATADRVSVLADRTCQLWRTPDAGLWELQTSGHYTISKIGCWVALDRAVRLAEEGQLASRNVDRWRSEREEVHDWVDQHCWSEAKRSYTFHADTDDLDAAVLLAARTGFSPRKDPRLDSTIDALLAELGAGGSLLFRYSGQQGKEGAFLACSGWLVEALVHTGREAEAAKLFDDLVSRANDVGLFSEEIDVEDGDLLGNTPQVLSHLAVIGAATALGRRAEAS